MNVTMKVSLVRRLQARFWYVWGLSLCYRGQRTANSSYYIAGVRAFARAARHWPTFAPPYYRSGLIRGREIGDYLTAIRDLDQATALHPEWPEPYLQRGLFHRFNDNPKAALAEFQAYLEHGGSGYWASEAERQIAHVQAELADQGGSRTTEPQNHGIQSLEPHDQGI